MGVYLRVGAYLLETILGVEAYTRGAQSKEGLNRVIKVYRYVYINIYIYKYIYIYIYIYINHLGSRGLYKGGSIKGGA